MPNALAQMPKGFHVAISVLAGMIGGIALDRQAWFTGVIALAAASVFTYFSLASKPTY